ncbi:hypothetical protein PENTCL1PPCAC_17569, partial [Pristionchus entomophagus]
SNAEEDDEFSNRETPPKGTDVPKSRPTAQRPVALTQGSMSDSYESDSSHSEKIEEEPKSPPPRKLFLSTYSIIKNRKGQAKLPPVVFYSTVRFDPIQDVVDFEGLGHVT